MEEVVCGVSDFLDALENKSEESLKLENTSIKYEDGRNYNLIEQIGTGYSSVVYRALHFPTQKLVACKVYKSRGLYTLQQEIAILRKLKNGENIIQLLGVAFFRDKLAPGLVLEKMGNRFGIIHSLLSEDLIKHYGMQILKALDYCHNQGIIHQDIKPDNIVVDLECKILKLIDWGSAIFYKPEIKISRFACTAGYTAPELLLDMKPNYSVDMWSVGCIFAEMIFRQQRFFNRIDKRNDLQVIVKVLGSKNFKKYCSKYDIHIRKCYRVLLFLYEETPFNHFTNEINKRLVNDNSLHLIKNLLRFDPDERLTAHKAINHKYFVDKKKSIFDIKFCFKPED